MQLQTFIEKMLDFFSKKKLAEFNKFYLNLKLWIMLKIRLLNLRRYCLFLDTNFCIGCFNGIHTPPTVKKIISIIIFMIVCCVAYWLFDSLIFSKIFGSIFHNTKEFVEFWTWLARMSELCRCVLYSLPLWCVCAS